jgi:hypothetical protein
MQLAARSDLLQCVLADIAASKGRRIVGLLRQQYKDMRKKQGMTPHSCISESMPKLYGPDLIIMPVFCSEQPALLSISCTGGCRQAVSELYKEAGMNQEQAAEARATYLSSKLPQPAEADQHADELALKVSYGCRFWQICRWLWHQQ